MLNDPLVMRAAFLNATVRFYQSLGTPVERELARAGLPSNISDLPNAYVSARLVTKFRNQCGKIERVPDVGWHIYGSYHMQMLNARFAKIADQAVTVNDRLKRFLDTVQMESSFVQCVLAPTATGTDVILNRPPEIDFDQDPVLWEWNRVLAIVTLVQSGAGTRWRPKKIGFVSKFQPCHVALEYFSNARILFGQTCTSISIPAEILALTVGKSNLRRRSATSETPEGKLKLDGVASNAKNLSHLRSALQAYLPEYGKPNLELAAEIAGMTKRSIQRRLREQGVSFTDLLDQCRYNTAARLLADPQNKIIDIALDVGYQHPGDFTRAFRRISGIPPRSFRRALLNGRIDVSKIGEAA